MRPNQTLICKRYTPYMPVTGEHLAVEPQLIGPDDDPPEGGVTIKNEYLSLDPYMRGQMRLLDFKATYSLPWTEGEPAVVTTLSTVLESDNSAFKQGDLVFAMADAGEYMRVSVPKAAMIRVLPSPSITRVCLIGTPGVAGVAVTTASLSTPRS
ncbi:chaperonin 10-like protein [Xylariaceae sp. FL0255]|nr:chaperonin 10-like protein [Xylariaceae sp. FL0255]